MVRLSSSAGFRRRNIPRCVRGREDRYTTGYTPDTLVDTPLIFKDFNAICSFFCISKIVALLDMYSLLHPLISLPLSLRREEVVYLCMPFAIIGFFTVSTLCILLYPAVSTIGEPPRVLDRPKLCLTQDLGCRDGGRRERNAVVSHRDDSSTSDIQPVLDVAPPPSAPFMSIINKM